jgi:hypothetical protein
MTVFPLRDSNGQLPGGASVIGDIADWFTIPLAKNVVPANLTAAGQ